MSIPVIGTAVIVDAYWVTRLIASVDHPVDDFFIVNNNGLNKEVCDALDLLAKMPHRFIKRIHVTHMPGNIGCGGAWNLIIRCYMHSPYWVITNDDVAFGPGLLKELEEKAEADPDIGMIHAYEGDFNVGSWDLFMIRDHIIQRFGLFDENLYPAYGEDADYHMRFVHNPIRKIMNLDATYMHGYGDKTQYHEHGKQSRKSHPELEEKLRWINDVNIEYLTGKWGPGWRNCWPTTAPWQGQGHHVKDGSFDLEFARKKHLGDLKIDKPTQDPV
jgi:GT2 family glycosyltransferase